MVFHRPAVLAHLYLGKWDSVRTGIADKSQLKDNILHFYSISGSFKMKVLLLTTITLSAMSSVLSLLAKRTSSGAGWVNEDGAAYPNGDLPGWNGYAYHLDDAEECRSLCQKQEGANYFTFRKKSGNCWCKKTRGKAKKEEDAHSGTVLDQD